MTNEEAIKLIDDRMCFGRGKWSRHHQPVIDEYWQAGEMAIKALEAEPHWIPVTEGLPEEEDSIFARYYGTDRWNKAMFRKKSRDVIVTSVFENGELRTEVAHTTDGKWRVGVNVVPITVIAWMPLPPVYQGE